MELITYETIRNAQRSEKEEELQKLPENFFVSIRNWFAHKEKLKDTTSLLEVENAKKLLEDVINRREKKIVLAALRTMRGELPPSNLTDEERKFFDSVIKVLKSFRENMSEKFKSYAEVVEEKIEDAKKSLEDLKKEEKKEENMENVVIKPNGRFLVKALVDLPRFVGSNLEAYGPLKAGDIITLPEDVGKLLISRKVAENILE